MFDTVAALFEFFHDESVGWDAVVVVFMDWKGLLDWVLGNGRLVLLMGSMVAGGSAWILFLRLLDRCLCLLE